MLPLLPVAFSTLLFLPIPPLHTSNCTNRCGRLHVPFPFGTAPVCALPGFRLTCIASDPPHLLIPNTTLRVTAFYNGQLRVDSTNFVAEDCVHGNRSAAHISLPADAPFTVSERFNTFTAIGCDTVAVISDGGNFTGGCVSLCSSKNSIPSGVCSGVGCCETALPKGRKYLGMGATNMNVSGFDNCSRSFVVEKGSLLFDRGDLDGFRRSIGLILDWRVGGGVGCGNASACGERAVCEDGSGGYLCFCKEGFAGNPYVSRPDGCKDVDECADPGTNPCVHAALCRNRAPGYKCKCPFGSTGDGRKSGSGCRKVFQVLEVVLGTYMCFGLMLLCALWYYSTSKQKALLKLKEQYFRENGGWLLKQQLSTREGAAECARLFTSDELQLATDNYSSARVIGTGGYGTVYKGVLEDDTVVAIKKSKVIDQAQVDQFINEVVILTQVHHRNVVKLLGCCLETQVPMLVYEYISNGTLHDHIHHNRRIEWKDRLRIMMETAEALAYLHSSISMPIFHRDVKSSNILLDDKLTAKVSDFGISRFVPLDQTQVSTLVQGTLGYLDPEYFQTGQLTGKSDVYSFGVVLVETLTGQKPVCLERKEESNLAMYFLSSLKSKEVVEFVDDNLVGEADVGELNAIAELARRCLLLRGEKRPCMKEVVQELAVIASRSGKDCVGEVEVEDYDVRNRSLVILESHDSITGKLTFNVDLAR